MRLGPVEPLEPFVVQASEVEAPAAIASFVAALAEPPAYRPVATDGAARAAALMAELL
jgi:hypothetical protein